MNSIKKTININNRFSLILLFILELTTLAKAQITFYGDSEPLKELNTPQNEDFLALDRFNHRLLFTRESGLSSDKNSRSLILSVANDTPGKIYSDDKYLTTSGSSSTNKQILVNATKYERGRYYSEIVSIKNNQPDGVLTIGNLDNLAPIQSGHLSADGNYLLISAQKSNGYGVEDLYISKRERGKWTMLQGLGFDINTAFQEISPFLAADNKTLIFASNREGGFGGMDLYISQRLDETWRNWSKPINLGSPVNTEGSETSLVFFQDDDFAYYISTTNSDGYGDINKIRIKAEILAAEIDSIELAPEIEPSQYSAMFSLKDASTNFTIQGKAFYFQESDTIELSADENLLILNELAAGQQVKIEFKSKGYLSESRKIGFNDLTEADSDVMEVLLEPLSKGNVITLKNVLFHRGTANFVAGTQSELDLVVEMLNENPEVSIFLKGHTDNFGNERLNTKLSEQRVLSVEKYLISKGISADKIDGKGYGGSQPKYSNEQEQTRKLNRRVEFEIVRD